jgi:hypothetical protein
MSLENVSAGGVESEHQLDTQRSLNESGLQEAVRRWCIIGVDQEHQSANDRACVIATTVTVAAKGQYTALGYAWLLYWKRQWVIQHFLIWQLWCEIFKSCFHASHEDHRYLLPLSTLEVWRIVNLSEEGSGLNVVNIQNIFKPGRKHYQRDRGMKGVYGCSKMISAPLGCNNSE